MKIGNVQLKNDLILAPMANYTDAGMRYLASVYGAGLTVTEMVSAKGLCFNNPNTAALLETRERGNCPVAKVVKNGEGSALLRNPDLVYKVVKAAVSATNRPVTVKIRAGFEKDEITAPEIAKVIEEAGGAAVAVHARTREQFYSGNADWNVIKKVKESVGIPVVGNGDVVTRDDYLRMKETTGCDGVMVGRAALGMPFIFAKLQDKEYEFDVKAAIMKHIEILGEYLPERTVINQMKAQLCFYAKNTRHAKDVRRAISELRTRDDLMRIIDEFF